MKTFFNKLVELVQSIPNIWFITIVCLLFALSLGLVVKFFKQYDGTQKELKKPSLIILSLISLVLVVFLIYLRN